MGSCAAKPPKIAYGEEEVMELVVENIDEPSCEICFKNIAKTRKMFGILPGCPHAFCFHCISKWNKSKHSKRGCPSCQLPILLVVPAPVFYRHNTVNKQRLLVSYIRNHDMDRARLRNGLTVEQYVKFIVCPLEREREEDPRKAFC